MLRSTLFLSKMLRDLCFENSVRNIVFERSVGVLVGFIICFSFQQIAPLDILEHVDRGVS